MRKAEMRMSPVRKWNWNWPLLGGWWLLRNFPSWPPMSVSTRFTITAFRNNLKSMPVLSWFIISRLFQIFWNKRLLKKITMSCPWRSRRKRMQKPIWSLYLAGEQRTCNQANSFSFFSSSRVEDANNWGLMKPSPSLPHAIWQKRL